ncbi:hypothetical protein NL676_030238 [Syzygium grande]|nr:hypothetical protein NL676_030238 [Syzygium grande]
MEQQMENRQVIFKGFIERVPRETDMEFRVGSINGSLKAPAGSGAFLVKNLYLSCDPYMRGRMRDSRTSYIPPFVPGQPIEGFGISKVIDSDDPDFKPGDLVSGLTGWEEYSLIRKNHQLRKIEQHDVPLSYHLGLLGMPGFTAYVGFHEICSPKQGDTVLVSAASGAVGQLVGQLAKLHGCYVVGSAGSSQKVDLLKNKLGFDEAFVYKDEPDLDVALKRYFPQGIDIYFDNVGRNAGCCASQHAGRMQGFLQSDYLHLFPLFFNQVMEYYKQGKISYMEDVVRGLEHAPAAFVGLFSGRNVGKQVIYVASP